MRDRSVPNRPKESIAAALRRNVDFAMGPGRDDDASRAGTWRDRLSNGRRTEFPWRCSVNLGVRRARLLPYGKGVPTELGSAKGVLDREWCLLQVVAKGPHIVARFNERPLIEAVDPSPTSGRAGIATAGPGLASFDEFITDPTEQSVTSP
jgi:hypothetical protein